MKTFYQFLENIRGEYWITDTGDVMFADGDVGDYNHEMHVIETMQIHIKDKLGGDSEEDYEEFKQRFAEEKYKEWKNRFPHREEYFDKKYVQDPEYYYFYPFARKAGFTDEDLSIANGSGDPRKYAMKNWGWKRVANNDVESWTLTPKDMKIIARGLGEIFNNEFDYDDNEDEDPEFTISTYGGKHIYMTLSQLEAGGKPQAALPVNPIAARNVANQQVKQMDIQSQHPTYKNFGDWFIQK